MNFIKGLLALALLKATLFLSSAYRDGGFMLLAFLVLLMIIGVKQFILPS